MSSNNEVNLSVDYRNQELNFDLRIYKRGSQSFVLIYNAREPSLNEEIVRSIIDKLTTTGQITPEKCRFFELILKDKKEHLSEIQLKWEHHWPEVEAWMPVDPLWMEMIASILAGSYEETKKDAGTSTKPSISERQQQKEYLEDIITEVVGYTKNSLDISHGVDEVFWYAQQKGIKLKKERVRKEIKTRVEKKLKKLNTTLEVKTNFDDRKVWLNKRELVPGMYKEVSGISQQHFDWGNKSKGSQLLAFAICQELGGKDKAMVAYQDFAQKHVFTWKRKDLEMKLTISI